MKKETNNYWRSLGQLSNDPEYKQLLLNEQETEQSHHIRQFSRRSFLSIMSASIALAGLAGCRRPVEKIVPYVKQSEEVIPGLPMHYASSMPLGTSAYGIIVENHEGRPTKIEGNPQHPSSLGSSNIYMQAEILNLYDPDRSQNILNNGKTKTIEDFTEFWGTLVESYERNGGQQLAVLSEPFSSPTLWRLRRKFLKRFPSATWVAYEPVSDEHSHQALKNLSGKELRINYNFEKAKVILSIDSDFLQQENESITAAAGFVDGRNPDSAEDDMNRLYVVESGFSLTGAQADHRLRLRSSLMGEFLKVLAVELDMFNSVGKIGQVPLMFMQLGHNRWIKALAADLVANKGQSLVVAGQGQPQAVHELAFLINRALGNIGQTVSFTESKDTLYSDSDRFGKLKDKMAQGQIETLIIAGGNPVFDAPVDYGIDKLIGKVKNSIRLGHFYDETSKKCRWHLPRAHFLESWGDTRSVNGTLSIIQPLIAPLFNGIGDARFFALLSSDLPQSDYDVVRDSWKDFIKSDFERGWRKALHEGLLENSDSTPSQVKLRIDRFSGIPKSDAGDLEIVFRPSALYDGRYANNGWLQELPDPITKLVWDNAALMSVKTASEYDLHNGDMVNLDLSGKSLNIPIWIIPGYADNSIGLSLGYGRKDIGRIADNVGHNVYLMRTANQMYITGNVELTKTGEKYQMANTQDHNRMEGRPIFREGTLDNYRAHPEFAREMVEHPPLKSIYPDYDYSTGNQWGMVIDLNSCIGCGVCTLACQSENNIPIVGKEQVGLGREMHWMRNDRYFEGDDQDPRMVIMPVTCQHCENAPCEQVCPVAATTHDKEGLNTMAYNRCIGTRYCSNNCPYKVRKFNFFNYTKNLPEVVRMAQNPDVTVRFRGVMEKCSFCIQRITRGKRNAKLENRSLVDGDVTAACQQACPTKAIRFGNIADKKSDVSRAKRIDRNYELLAELNVRPRNSYLARILNPNPAFDDKPEEEKNRVRLSDE